MKDVPLRHFATEDDKDVKISEVKNDESEQKNKEDEQNKLYASLFG